jgi:CHAT domain-containing protein
MTTKMVLKKYCCIFGALITFEDFGSFCRAYKMQEKNELSKPLSRLGIFLFTKMIKALKFIFIGISICFSTSIYAQNAAKSNLDSAQYYVENQSFLTAYLFCKSALKILETDNSQNLKLQYQTYFEYINVIHQVIKWIESPDSKRLFYELEYQSYERIIELARLLFKKYGDSKYCKTAFELVERNRNMMLLQTLRDGEKNHFAGIPDEILQQEGKFISTLASLDNERSSALQQQNMDKKRIEAIEIKRDKTQEAYQIFRKKINERYPNYSFQESKAISIEQLQKHLTHEEALVQYFYGSQAVYVFVITKKNIELVRLADTPKAKHLIHQYRQVLQDNERTLVKTSNLLYQTLFQPVEKHLKGISAITIITDGLLSYVPFDGLIKKIPANWNYDFSTLEYLIFDYQISYHNSAKELVYPYSPPHIFKDHKILTIAPLFSEELKNQYKKTLPKDTLFDACTALLASEKIVAAIHKQFATKSLFEQEANFTNFSKHFNRPVIHFATHTIIDEAQPLRSKIILAKDINNHFTSENGYLHLKDLYEMSLNSELVVLGSCETGNGQFKIGEGMVGFSYGFNMAGAQSTVYSLWKVDEKATVRLMASFYKFLSQGLPKDKALHLAKLEFIEHANELQSNPYYWSGFVFHGQKKPLQFHQSNLTKQYFIPAFVVFLLLLAAFVKMQF